MSSTGTTGIALNSNADLMFGTIGLKDIGTTFNNSGAYLIGFNTAITSYVTTSNVQQAIEQLDIQLGSALTGVITAVGSMTSGDTFANNSANNQWLGLGANAGRLYFTDSTVDKISFLDAYLGIGTSNPLNTLDIKENAVIGNAFAGIVSAPSNSLLVQGVLGIGTSNPLNTLDVLGSAVIGSGYAGTNTAPANSLLVQGSIGINTTNILNGFELMVNGDMNLASNGYLNFGSTFGSSGYGIRDFGG